MELLRTHLFIFFTLNTEVDFSVTFFHHDTNLIHLSVLFERVHLMDKLLLFGFVDAFPQSVLCCEGSLTKR